MVTIIVAMTKNRTIGKNNQIPWHLSEDLKNFKRITTNNTVIMGRKTFDSIGKPLPNRNNIVISRTPQEIPGVVVCNSIPDAIKTAKEYNKEIFIIGGATIYEAALHFTDKMLISYIKNDYEGDIYFPAFNKDDWILESEEDKGEFTFCVYKRKSRVA